MDRMMARGSKPLSRHEYMEQALARFWRDVKRGSADECWPWTGQTLLPSRKNMIYGRFCILSDGRTKNYRAHRFAWMLTNGAIPDGLNVLHRCDNTLCCNPEHLFIGTQRDNIDDQIAKDRWLCCQEAGRAKLTNEIVLAMRKSDKPHTYFARKYGVHPTTIANARSGKKWAKLEEHLSREISGNG